MRIFWKHFFYSLLLISTLLLLTSPVAAADFRSDYKVEYFLSETENSLSTRVKFTVSITNFRTDVFVKQFAIGFPDTFTIKNIKASDDDGPITPEIETTDSLTKIALEFTNPSVGKNSKGNFFLEFNQENLFIVNGNVWEVIIPTVDNKQDGSYTISVHLPAKSDKKISISKPKPSNISGNTITWSNPKTKTIYAVFGQLQHYQTDLTYNLKNEKLIPVYTDVAFPPDTLYQRVFVDKIEPTPDKVFADLDGNYLGRYFLNPREAKTIHFNGSITVFSKPREEIMPEMRRAFVKQKKYLLHTSKYWQITDEKVKTSLPAEAKSIYDFTTKTLSYNYKKIETENARLGADQVLRNPTNAVCMEFTDLFIAAARDKKIYSREIEGYGFSQDPKLRPISLVSDILHSWPEYYDQEAELWQQIDPTWEDTSGIDYFTSFDLNHIAFVIHGEDPEYPYPAGTYKTEESRDLTVSASNKAPEPVETLLVKSNSLPKKINDNKTYRAKFTLTNAGNVFLWLKPPQVEADNVEIRQTSEDVIQLAPQESKVMEYTFNSLEKNKTAQGNFNILFSHGKSVNVSFSIVPFYYEIALMLGLGVSFLAGFAFLIILVKKAKKLP